MPKATAHNPLPGHNALPASMPGTNNEKAVAASITPAAAPSKVLKTLLETSLKKAAGNAPSPVAKLAKTQARKPIIAILPKNRYKAPKTIT
ncbi:hypothetical protein [uncultured Gammaproteobacteria bacterium]|nr:hypothetical protein [uncultured Gammaproteobacteria bacterium]